MDNILQDSQSIISDITENNDNNTTISFEIEIKVNEITSKLNSELNKLNLDSLKDKAKDLGVSGISKSKKPDLIQILENEFIKLLPILKEKKSNDLKNICKQCGIKGVAGYKKDYLVCQILEYHSSILKFKLDDIQEEKEKEKEKEREPDIKIEQLSLIEQLEKQKQEIELKMKEETKRQKEEEEKRQKEKEKEEEEKRQKEEEEKKQKDKEEETKRQKEKEKEKEEKKKKQSIPKNVRVIIWNHYIGEDIIKHKCLCCKKVTISNTNFDVGHVLSEKNGGTHEINNLRPICFACNHSMGSENMIDFVVKFGLFIG
jgi:5-methylcytosine-specific restriction endonuclease McrA